MPRFVNLKKLGSGGFGKVHQCRRKEDGAIFAKKKLVASDIESLERFRREVRTLSKLDHPRIVKVVASRLTTEPLFYVMPLYDSSLIAEFPEIVGDAKRIAKVFGAVLEGMEYSHKQGIVHRDLKPGNILLNSGDEVVIGDFGLGRSMTAVSTRITRTGAGFGTHGYAAPEQEEDAKQADSRSDVFALGRILYELYTGDKPSAVQDLLKVPPGIAAIVERCTKTDPAKRFQDAGELRQAMVNYLGIAGRKTNEANLKTLLASAVAKDDLSTADVNALAEAIDGMQEDTDLIHEVCVQLPGAVLHALWKRNFHLVRKIVRQFADQVAAQGWGFDYVDKLGNACVRIWNAVPDPKVRAAVAFAIVDVSVGHNRWRVIGQAVDVLHASSSPDLDMEVALALEPVVRQLRSLADKLNKAKLGPHVLALLSSEGG